QSAIISLGELHPDIRDERRTRLFSKEIVGRRNNFYRVGVRGGVFEPDREIIGSFAGGRAWLALPRAIQILFHFIETRRGGVKVQLRQRHPRFGRASVSGELAEE